jgi:hypothetical protein
MTIRVLLASLGSHAADLAVERHKRGGMGRHTASCTVPLATGVGAPG